MSVMVRSSRQFRTVRFLKGAGVSLFIHLALVILFNANPWPVIVKQPMAYTVTLVPVSLPEPETQKSSPLPIPKQDPPKPIERMKPPDKPKKDDIVEKIKKAPKKPEPPKELEKPKEDPETLKRLQEAIEEIRRKAALDEIQKRVARRQTAEERPPVPVPKAPPSPPPAVPSPKIAPPPKTPAVASTPSPRTESILSEYYSLIWAKIKEEWTIPENVLKDRPDLEVTIVIVIARNGTIQKSWFEQRSGNALYDQMAMRALRKADPLPPIPKEWNESTLEIGIRFLPD